MSRGSLTVVTLTTLAVSLGVGCAGAERSPAAPEYDSQACVEDALRRSPDPTLAVEAAQAFSSACAMRDRAACSMLGVAYELGFGVPHSLSLARSYYGHACEAGNARACGNLGELSLASARSAADTSAAIGMLGKACAAGQARHCAALGRELASGDRLPEERARATSLFDRACRGGDGKACLALAREIDGTGSGGALERSFELLLVACAQGERIGCAELAAQSPHPRAVAARAP